MINVTGVKTVMHIVSVASVRSILSVTSIMAVMRKLTFSTDYCYHCCQYYESCNNFEYYGCYEGCECSQY